MDLLHCNVGRDAQLQFAKRTLLNAILELAVEMDTRIEHLDQQRMVHADQLVSPRFNPPRLPTDRQVACAAKWDPDEPTERLNGVLVGGRRCLPTPAARPSADLHVQILRRQLKH